MPNTAEATVRELTPVAVTGHDDIPVGACASWPMGARIPGAFTIGDQLLWGAAEPLRRMLRILLLTPEARSIRRCHMTTSSRLHPVTRGFGEVTLCMSLSPYMLDAIVISTLSFARLWPENRLAGTA